jgi:hypothetical protein
LLFSSETALSLIRYETTRQSVNRYPFGWRLGGGCALHYIHW